MALTRTELAATLADTTNVQAYASASASPSANALLIAHWTLTDTVTPATPTVANSPWGLTWTAGPTINGTIELTEGRIGIFYATTASAPGADTFDLSATGGAGGNQTGCTIQVVEFTDSSGVAPRYVQGASDSNGSNSDFLLDTLAPIGNHSWVEASFVCNDDTPNVTADSGWTKGAEKVYTSPAVGHNLLHSNGLTTDNTPSAGYLNDHPWIGVAVEISVPPWSFAFGQNRGAPAMVRR